LFHDTDDDCNGEIRVQRGDDDEEEDDEEDMGQEEEEEESADDIVVMKFRIMYTSFVRCLRYLQCIQEEAQLRKTHTHLNDTAVPVHSGTTTAATAVQQPTANLAVEAAQQQAAAPKEEEEEEQQQQDDPKKKKKKKRRGLLDNSNHDQESRATNTNNKKPRYANSSLTDRLLLLPPRGSGDGVEKKTKTPTPTAVVVHQLLPWSCAVYSIVNWMVAYSNVPGIQMACFETLHVLLELDEQQRMTALRAGLGQVLLDSMHNFSTSAALHTAAFYALVVLARPMGGREGMLLLNSNISNSISISRSTMTTDSEIFGSGGVDRHEQPQQQKHGVDVLLDSMRRFHNHEMLQATACWSLVNLALIPAQRRLLVQRGAIQAVVRAMSGVHSSSAQVQHRALFALVNLVIPSSSSAATSAAAEAAVSQQLQPGQQEHSVEEEEEEERTLVDASVESSPCWPCAGFVPVPTFSKMLVSCCGIFRSFVTIVTTTFCCLHHIATKCSSTVPPTSCLVRRRRIDCCKPLRRVSCITCKFAQRRK
jgi:hypothetical protein